MVTTTVTRSRPLAGTQVSGERMSYWKKIKKIGSNIDDDVRRQAADVEDATRKFFSNPAQEMAAMFAPDWAPTTAREMQAAFVPEFGAPQMERQTKEYVKAMRANQAPTIDDARKQQDMMASVRRRRGRAAAMLSQNYSGQTTGGASVSTPTAGAGTRALLG